jgi:hypothetical protein
MNIESAKLTARRRSLLFLAAEDFFYFQNHRYPRAPALRWVGDRYALTEMERQLLNRGVFGQQEALRRLGRLCRGTEWCDEVLVVDGHNVQITVESAILGRLLLRANDGALRDLAGQSARFRLTEVSASAVDLVIRLLTELRPREALFLFDAPMSHSGLLAAMYRERMKSLGLSGESRTVPVPEREIPYGRCVVASSDRAVLDRASRWLDLAHASVLAAGLLRLEADFSTLVFTHQIDPQLPPDLASYC